MKTIKFDSELGYYIINFEPIDVINEAYNCISSSDSLQVIERSQDWFEIQYETGGLCIVKFEDKFYLCDRQYYENIAGFYNHNGDLMDKEYVIETCPKCSDKLRVKPKVGFGLNLFLICDNCNIYFRFNNEYKISDLDRYDNNDDDIMFVKTEVNCYCCFYYKTIIYLSDFEYNSLQELHNKLLKIKDLMIFN